MENIRILNFVAKTNGTVEANLKLVSVSTSIQTSLRKEFGLVRCDVEGSLQPIRLVDKLQQGQHFQIVLKDEIVRKILPYDFPLKIVFEDEDLAVVDKPCGLAVISTHKHYAKSLENALANIWGDFVYRPVNRLDKNTSGLMIVAKNVYAHSQLSKTHIAREYLALVDGILNNDGFVDSPIGRPDPNSVLRGVMQDGKPAKTFFQTEKVFNSHTLAKIQLTTGRTHQIRVHMASIGHPLSSDELYNQNKTPVTLLDKTQIFHHCLHSHKIEFLHPTTHKMMSFESTCPFCEILD